MTAPKPSRKMRKPVRLESPDSSIYANFDETYPNAEECFVYVGGRNYQSTAQIHLSKRETLQLADWLTKVARWMRSKNMGGK